MSRHALISIAAGLLLTAGPNIATAAPARKAPKKDLSEKPPARRPAPDGRDAAEKAARAEFEQAERAFNLGKFDEALIGYEAAYESLPLPAFLFNLAQCHRNMGHLERAVFFYQRYLSLEPAAPNRTVVEELIADQQRKLAATKPDTPARPVNLTPSPTPPSPARTPVVAVRPARLDESPPRFYKKWWFWTAIGVAVVGGVATALVLGQENDMPSGTLGAIDAR